MREDGRLVGSGLGRNVRSDEGKDSRIEERDVRRDWRFEMERSCGERRRTVVSVDFEVHGHLGLCPDERSGV